MQKILVSFLIFTTLFSFAQSKVYAGEAYQAAADALFNVELTITKDKKYYLQKQSFLFGARGDHKFSDD